MVDPSTETRPALDGRHALVYTHCRLTVLTGPDAGRRLETEADLIRLGQAPDNDLAVRDPAVSRHHAELSKDAGQFRLADVGSTNGTWAAGLKVRDVTLAARTEIVLGDSTVLFEPLSTELVFEPSGEPRLGELVGDARVMRELFTVAARVAPTELAVLLTGETGTGKDLFARELHLRSKRREGPLVVLSLGALPPALLESALFGHEAGAVAGAEQVYAGAFERAQGGTLVLDEIDALPLELQPRVLRAIERREIQRLGSDRPVRVDARLVATSSDALTAMVDAGRLRRDLYFRLSAIRLELPPLRDRLVDLPLLAEAFFDRFRAELDETGVRAKRLSVSALAQLQRHDFPGNVRELFNVLRAAAIRASGEDILASELPPELTEVRRAEAGAPGMTLPDASMPFKDAKAQVLDAFERQYLQDLLVRHRHNISRASREAGIDRRHLYRLLDKYAIEVKDRGED